MILYKICHLMNLTPKDWYLSEPSSDRKFIRWVTWWPVSYWTERFEYLASRADVEFEAIFLTGGSDFLESNVDADALNFRHSFLSRRSDSIGYYDPKLRFPKPWQLVRGHFDALVMTYAEASCIAAAILCWGLRKPYFLFVGNTKYDERKSGRLKEWLKRALLNKATGVLATGPLQREYALQYVRDVDKVTVIGNPVASLKPELYSSPECREKLRKRFGWKNETVLLYVGRLAPEKGLLTLLDAVSRVYNHGSTPTLVLVGSGPLEADLRARALELGIKAQFTGFLQREELAQRYAAADIFVLPSRSEPWGLVVNEAMEFGLPLILSSNVGSAPVLLKEGENGLLFAAGDSASLASSIERLCSDAVLRERMGEISRQIIRDHSLQSWAEAVLSAITRVAKV